MMRAAAAAAAESSYDSSGGSRAVPAHKSARLSLVGREDAVVECDGGPTSSGVREFGRSRFVALAALAVGILVCLSIVTTPHPITTVPRQIRHAAGLSAVNRLGGGHSYVWSLGYAMHADHSVCTMALLGNYWVASAYSPCRWTLRAARIEDGDTVWIQTRHLPAFVQDILPLIRKDVRFTLRTGGCDFAAPAAVPCFGCPGAGVPASTEAVSRKPAYVNLDQWHAAAAAVLLSNNVVHWFTQNLCLYYDRDSMSCVGRAGLDSPAVAKHWGRWIAAVDLSSAMAKVEPMAIGLDLHTSLKVQDAEKFGTVHSSIYISEQEAELDSIADTLPHNRDRPIAVYLAFNTRAHDNVNSHGEEVPGYVQRLEWLDLFAKPPLKSVSVQPEHRLPRTMLWADWGRAAFVASPAGNGLDCHRTYEALLMGNIVLAQNVSSAMNKLYEGLPVVIINDLASEITVENLRRWHKELNGRGLTDLSRVRSLLTEW